MSKGEGASDSMYRREDGSGKGEEGSKWDN